jgi:hypothetical protein
MLAESTLNDEMLPEEIVAYKPLSPAAALSLVAGFAAVIAACSVWDLGWPFLVVPVVAFLMGLKGLASVRRYDMAGKGAAMAALVLSILALVGGTGAHIYLLKTAVPRDYATITYEVLQADGAPIPKKAEALNGKKIYIPGYMYPGRKSQGITRFMLCRDNGTCCFGGQPKLNDMVDVKLKEGLTVDQTSSLRGIGGTLRVNPEKDPGGLGTVLFHIDDADVVH